MWCEFDVRVCLASMAMAHLALQSLREAAVGDYVMVRHRGEKEYQERLITFKSSLDDRMVMLTPDEDHYAVEPSSWFDAVYPEGRRGGLASTVRKSGELVYRFDQRYGPAELARILEEGRAIALAEGMIRARGPSAIVAKGAGAPPPLPAPRPAPVDAAGKLLSRVTGKRAPDHVPRLPLALDGDTKWRLAEPTELDDIGMDVSTRLIAGTTVGTNALCSIRGQAARAELVSDADFTVWVASYQEYWDRVVRRCAALLTPRAEEVPPPDRAAEEEVAAEDSDARILPVILDELGRREVRFQDAVKRLTETSFPDWDLDGPRTVLYCVREVSRTGAPPIQRVRQWKLDNRLGDDDAGVDFAEFAAEMMETAICRDQLQVSNLLCFEILERKRQMVEEAYRQRADEQKLLKAASSSAAVLTSELFRGRSRMAGGAIISPLLIEYVAKKSGENSEILKQQRKALEVRGLAAPKAAGKK